MTKEIASMFEHAPESKFILKFIVDPKSSFQERKRIYRKFILPSATVLYYLLNKILMKGKGILFAVLDLGKGFPLLLNSILSQDTRVAKSDLNSTEAYFATKNGPKMTQNGQKISTS